MKKQLSNIALSPEKLFMTKLMLLCISLAFATTLYFIGTINFVCLIMVYAGGLWNFFAKINSFAGLFLCFLTSVICGLQCISVGLYSHSILYFVFYIALELVVFVMNMKGNTLLVRYKNISPNESYFVVMAIFLFCVSGFAVSLCQNNMIVPAIDAVCSSLLALSAYLHSRNFREYYVVRPIALAVTIAMFSYLISINIATSATISMLVMYVMYFALDAIEQIFRISSSRKVNRSLRIAENATASNNLIVSDIQEDAIEQKNKRGKDIQA